MVAFTDGGATVQPSIGDDSDEDESNTVRQVDQELIRPLMNIAEEAAGCVSTIEERLRMTRGNKSNQSITIDCPKSCVNIVPIVPNTCIQYCVLNNNGTVLSNSNLVGVSNDSVIPSNSNVDTSTCNKSKSSNSGKVVAVGNIPQSDQSSNVALATVGINNSSIKNRGALNSD
ncbi:unnamed protein product, partial [Rotaria magnacalcarata]